MYELAHRLLPCQILGLIDHERLGLHGLVAQKRPFRVACVARPPVVVSGFEQFFDFAPASWVVNTVTFLAATDLTSVVATELWIALVDLGPQPVRFVFQLLELFRARAVRIPEATLLTRFAAPRQPYSRPRLAGRFPEPF